MMDEAAPITWLIDQINTIVSSGANSTASAITTTITPLVSVCYGIYMLLICLNYMRGAETEPVIDLALRIASGAVIVGLGLSAATYTSTIIPIVTNLGSDLSAAVSGGTATANTLDQLALHYLDILDKGYQSANAPNFPSNVGTLLIYALKAILVIVGLIPFLVSATLCLIVASVGSIIIASIGPLFFAFLLFPATRQYFNAWLNTAFSYAFIPLIVAIIAMISVSISKEMFTSTSGNLDKVTIKTVFLASMGNLTLLFLLKQVSSIASALSAGGINASMPGSIGTLAKNLRSSAHGSARDARAISSAASAMNKGARSITSKVANKANSIRKAG